MGGKSSAPAAPNYGPLALAEANVGNQQFVLGQQQMQQTQNQFNTVWPYAQQYMQQQSASSAAETANAQQQQQYFNQTYKPLESQFANEASTYNSPQRAQQREGMAMQTVSNEFDQQRNDALAQLTSYGIDPSQTRFGALDLGTRISKATAMAGAGNQSLLNSEATGLALQGEAINVGRGYPSAIAQSYNTATNSGQSGITAANQTSQTATQGMGTAGNIMGGASNSYGSAVGALNTGFNNSMAGANFNANQSSQFSQGLGSLIGGGLGMAAMMM